MGQGTVPCPTRDNEILKGGNEFTYEEMGDFFENT